MAEHRFVRDPANPLDHRCACGATFCGVLDNVYPKECISAEHTKAFYDEVMSVVEVRIKARIATRLEAISSYESVVPLAERGFGV
jgi:hypothetical protein